MHTVVILNATSNRKQTFKLKTYSIPGQHFKMGIISTILTVNNYGNSEYRQHLKD